MKESGVVVTVNGNHYWYESLDKRAYKNELEAKLALEHSVKIASGLKNLVEGGRTYFVKDELVPNSEYSEVALAHLRTGYEKIFELFEKGEKARQQAYASEKVLRKVVTESLVSYSLQTEYPEILATMVLNDIKETLRGRQAYFLNDLRIQDELVKSGSYSSFAKKEQIELVKKFILEQETSERNKEIGAEIVESESKYFNIQQEVGKEIKSLIMQAENGTPLKGKCQLCPKIEINGRSISK